MSRRFLPHPRLSLFVALIWLALVNEISAGAVVMGVALGILMPILTGPFWPDPPQAAPAAQDARSIAASSPGTSSSPTCRSPG